MNSIMNFPFLVFALSIVVLWLSARLGVYFAKLRGKLADDDRDDFGLVVAATLTLLGLIIGFSFSMAVTRYDQRKNYEEAEANAIGTEYVRADLLPAADAMRLRTLLKNYLDLRISFYEARDRRQLGQINASTAQVQAELWSAAQAPAMAQPSPVIALAVSGMNDVLNSQGYTQAAWWNRIPTAAWGLMVLIAICCNLLIGYGAHHGETRAHLLLILPLVLSISFLLIADIDSPRGGIIRVRAQNLQSLAQSLQAH
jgi:hypothetical protein